MSSNIDNYMFKKIFKELDLPENTLRVFNELIEKGPSTARQLALGLNIPRPSIYDNVNLLIEKGLVTERNQDNKKIFSIDNVKNIPELLQSKIDTLKSEKEQIEKLLPSLLNNVGSVEPKIKFYSGIEGLKQVMNHIMLNRNIDTILFWPTSDIVKIFGKEYMIELNKKRIKRNISIRAIYPQDKVLNLKEYPFFGIGGGHLREARLAPKNMTWGMGYWMYEDKVAFISSQKESFGFVVHSKDFAQLLKTQFDAIWNISKSMKAEPHHTDKFLESLT